MHVRLHPTALAPMLSLEGLADSDEARQYLPFYANAAVMREREQARAVAVRASSAVAATKTQTLARYRAEWASLVSTGAKNWADSRKVDATPVMRSAALAMFNQRAARLSAIAVAGNAIQPGAFNAAVAIASMKSGTAPNTSAGVTSTSAGASKLLPLAIGVAALFAS